VTNEELIRNVDLSKPNFRARSSEVYDVGDNKVIKLYFADADDCNVNREYLNTSVAFQKDCTAMECFGKVRIDGRNGLMLRKMNGRSLTSMPEQDPLILFRAGKILAQLHSKVHEQCSHELVDVRVAALEALENSVAASFLSDADRKKLEDYIKLLPESDNIIHLDFHTDNILCDRENYYVIDWMTANRGNPLVEVSMMNFLLHDAELFPGSSKVKIFLMQLVRIGIYNSYIKNYEKITGRKREDSRQWDVIAYILRLCIWKIESEREDLQLKIQKFVNEIPSEL